MSKVSSKSMVIGEQISKMANELSTKIMKLKTNLHSLCRKLDKKGSGKIDSNRFFDLLITRKMFLDMKCKNLLMQKYGSHSTNEITYSQALLKLNYNPSASNPLNKWYVDAERDTSRNNADRMYKTISHNISSRNIRNSKSVGSYYVQRMHKIQENNQPQPINNNLEQNSEEKGSRSFDKLKTLRIRREALLQNLGTKDNLETLPTIRKEKEEAGSLSPKVIDIKHMNLTEMSNTINNILSKKGTPKEMGNGRKAAEKLSKSREQNNINSKSLVINNRERREDNWEEMSIRSKSSAHSKYLQGNSQAKDAIKNSRYQLRLNKGVNKIGTYLRATADMKELKDYRENNVVDKNNLEIKDPIINSPEIKTKSINNLTPVEKQIIRNSERHSKLYEQFFSSYDLIGHQHKKYATDLNAKSQGYLTELRREPFETNVGKKTQNQIRSYVNRLQEDIKECRANSSPECRRSEKSMDIQKGGNFYHYSALNIPPYRGGVSDAGTGILPAGEKLVLTQNMKEVISLLYKFKIEPRQLNVLRMGILSADLQNTGSISGSEFMRLLKLVIPQLYEYKEILLRELMNPNQYETVSYERFCGLIDSFQYEPFHVSHAIRKMDTLPQDSNGKIYTDKNEKDIDVMLDFVWCKIHEKFKKISKAFRSMDLQSKGKLNIAEFRLGLEKLNIRLDKEITQQLFGILDQDQDGYLTFNEFTYISKGTKDKILSEINERNERQSMDQILNATKTKISDRNREKRLMNEFKTGEYLGLQTGDTVMEYLLEPDNYEIKRPKTHSLHQKRTNGSLRNKGDLGRTNFIKRMMKSRDTQESNWKMSKFKNIRSRLGEGGSQKSPGSHKAGSYIESCGGSESVAELEIKSAYSRIREKKEGYRMHGAGGVGIGKIYSTAEKSLDGSFVDVDGVSPLISTSLRRKFGV